MNIIRILEGFLLRKNYKTKVCFLILLFNLSCSKTIYDINQIKKLESTHTIQSNLITKALIDFEDKGYFDNEANTYVIYVDKKNDFEYELSITKTEFYFFRTEKSEFYFKDLKGYLNYNSSIFLLYGEIDDILFNTEKVKVEDIMFYNSSVENGSLIYEPTFIEYLIKNDKLIEKGSVVKKVMD